MDWKDCTSYSRGNKERIPTAFELRFPSGLLLVIMSGHIYYKGEWVMHCFNVGIDAHPLIVKTQEEAQRKAIRIVKAKIKRWYDELNGEINGK